MMIDDNCLLATDLFKGGQILCRKKYGQMFYHFRLMKRFIVAAFSAPAAVMWIVLDLWGFADHRIR